MRVAKGGTRRARTNLGGFGIRAGPSAALAPEESPSGSTTPSGKPPGAKGAKFWLQERAPKRKVQHVRLGRGHLKARRSSPPPGTTGKRQPSTSLATLLQAAPGDPKPERRRAWSCVSQDGGAPKLPRPGREAPTEPPWLLRAPQRATTRVAAKFLRPSAVPPPGGNVAPSFPGGGTLQNNAAELFPSIPARPRNYTVVYILSTCGL